jgi:hypothetical protein
VKVSGINHQVRNFLLSVRLRGNKLYLKCRFIKPESSEKTELAFVAPQPIGLGGELRQTRLIRPEMLAKTFIRFNQS